MKLLGRAEVIAAIDYKFVDLPVPEWGEDVGVRIRTMTSGERSRFENTAFTTIVEPGPDGKPVEKKIAAKINIRALVLGACMIDQAGGRLFDDESIALLDSKNAEVVSRLFDECMKLNKMQGDAVAEAAKNSERAPEPSSDSGSRANSESPSLV